MMNLRFGMDAGALRLCPVGNRVTESADASGETDRGSQRMPSLRGRRCA